ncbi:POT family-domain-containing protein [Phaeosphaeria sp. MPI-PUGE-AT-0046c]|nr:POT family-domain-containing protein [Phaeosphaeria sp. MPI-PUGE-AT-0046c]
MASVTEHHNTHDNEKAVDYPNAAHDHALLESHYEGKPTPEELLTLRRVAGPMPTVAYLICAVEFAERASYYGVQQLIGNFVNRPLPKGGNGWGAPPKGTQQTAGALGMGTVKANAVSQSFQMLTYVLPIFFGWLADTKLGRFKVICYGVGVFGIAHALMVVSASKSLLADGSAKTPYFLSLYILAVGAAMFKPNVSPMLLDQMTTRVPVVKTLKSGERVIEDPEATTERVMLWFYLLINVGGFMGVATTYSEKYIGWWLAFVLPLFLYLPLPFLLWFLKGRLVLHPPGGSNLGRVFKLIGVVFRRGGIKRFGRHGFWKLGKPSEIAAAGLNIKTDWNDEFVDDVARAFQATGIFCFFPIQYINDNGLGGSAGYLSTMLTTNGVPNDVIQNFNSLSIICTVPIFNYGIYPTLRKAKIHYGPIARITTGLIMSSLGGVGYTVLTYYAYQQSPCGKYGSDDCEIGTGVAPISIWLMAIPYAVGGISEIFVNVPAYGIAYSRAPVSMRGLVSAINLFNTGVAYAIGLACSAIVRDPLLIWVFGGPAIIGFCTAIIFYFTFRKIDKEELVMRDESAVDYHLDSTGTKSVVRANSINATSVEVSDIAKNEEVMISQKQ